MAPRPAVVLLDQMLDHPVEKTPFLKGTDMITRLRDLGFEGKIVIYSANHTPLDARFYRECGADGVVTKSLNALDMSRQLARILLEEPGECAIDFSVFEGLSRDERHVLISGFTLEMNTSLTRLQAEISCGNEKAFTHAYVQSRGDA